MYVEVWYDFLQGTPSGCGLYRGERGENGPLVYTLFSGFFSAGSSVAIPIAVEDVEDLWGGRVYVVIQTEAFPDGEIRGQLRPAPDAVESSTWGGIKAVWK